MRNIITIDAAYESQNPQSIQLAVELAGDWDEYKEIRVLADILIGIVVGLQSDIKTQGEVRVLITTNGAGDDDHHIAIYPQREQENAINPNWI